MSFDARTLYELLPAIHRIRDSENGEPLKALLAVIAEQIAVLEEDLEQLYDDQFIESCADWVVPYIGQLIGYRSLHGTTAAVASPRAEVANTIRFRRRKGTAVALEQLAADVTGWSARVSEMFQTLATTQYMNHLRPENAWTVDLRRLEALDRAGSAFDRLSHGVEVGAIAIGRGRHNIPNIGIFLWRLKPYRLERVVASRLDDRRFFFNPLGHDTPLFTKPPVRTEVTVIATPIDVPDPIGRRVLRDRLADYYGADRSFFVERRDGAAIKPVALTDIEVCNLSDREGGAWSTSPPDKPIAIDPMLGRLLFRDAQPTAATILASYHYGFSGDCGGGTYERSELRITPGQPRCKVPGDHATIQAALDALQATGGVIEIDDSLTYREALTVRVPAGGTLTLRAANERRPTLLLAAPLQVIAAPGNAATVVLDGLVIANHPVVVANAPGLRRLTLRDLTLVPGLRLTAAGLPTTRNPSLVLNEADVDLVIERVITGGLRVHPLSRASISDSIVDATAPEEVAYTGPPARGGTPVPGGQLSLAATTFFGRVRCTGVDLITDSIIAAAPGDEPALRVDRTQAGCMRFSFVPPGSVTPRRFRCQPEHESTVEIERRELAAGAPLNEAAKTEVRRLVEAWLRPGFSAQRYGHPAYAQLGRAGPPQIATGAENESEMGAFRALQQPQRETNLRVRLAEYLRFGLEAGVFYET